MTDKEKARAYDEALERAKSFQQKFGRDYAGYIFPELRESDDERIRRQLINVCNDYLNGDYSAKPCLNDIKWLKNLLEKQKEQKPVENISQLTAKGKGVYKICPRCKERMVRDDSKVYTSMPPQYGYKCPKCGEVEFDTVIYDNPKIEEQKPLDASGTAEPDYGICDDYIPAALHLAMARHGWYAYHVGEEEGNVLKRKKYVERSWLADKDNLTQEQENRRMGLLLH